MCIKYVRTGLVKEAQKTRASTIHACEMCFRIEKHILHSKVRANTKNTRHFSTHFYFLCVRVFLCVSYQPCVRKYNWANLSKTRRQFLAVNYSPLLEFFWNWETYKITEKLNRKKKKKLKPIFIIVVGC